MKVTTKFNVGDTVTYLIEETIRTGDIQCINISSEIVSNKIINTIKYIIFKKTPFFKFHSRISTHVVSSKDIFETHKEAQEVCNAKILKNIDKIKKECKYKISQEYKAVL